MIRSLSRVLTAFRLKHKLPDSEPGAATLARGIISPSNEVVAEVNADGAFVLSGGQDATLDSLGWVDGALPTSLGGTGRISKPYCSVRKSAAQVMLTGIDEKVVLDTEEVDVGGIWDDTTSRATMPRDGLVAVSAIIVADAAAWYARLKINGSTERPLSGQFTYGVGAFAVQFPVSAGDYVELWAIQSSGSDKSIYSGVSETRIAISYID